MSNLTHTEVRAAKSGPKVRKISDGGGLTLVIQPNGSKLWHLRYRWQGKEQTASLGIYPEVKLGDAREKRDELKVVLSGGQNPNEYLREARMSDEERVAVQAAQAAAEAAEIAANTFDALAGQYIDARGGVWVPTHALRVRQRLARYISPTIGAMPVREITPRICLDLIQKVESQGIINTSKRVAELIGSVMSYATALGLADGDPTAVIKGALKPAPRAKHRAALLDPDALAEFMNDLWGWAGRTFSKPLLKACLFTFQRPGEVRAMRWADIDWGRRLWMPHITKTDVAHAVPLSDQMIVLLREMEQITGEQKFVFALSQKPISDVATNQMIKKLGWQGRVTAHGFRATARTVLAERLSFEPRHIELQLAHAVPETHGGAYNRALHLAERTAMMQAWADWLDKVRTGESVENKVVHFKT